MKLLETKRTTPYPTIQCLLREIALAFDTKSYLSDSVARKLGDQCKKLEIHIHEYESLKEASVIEPIRMVFDDEIAARITIFLRLITTRYFEWIEEHPLDGISVLQANNLFKRTRFFECLIAGTFFRAEKEGVLCLPYGTNLLLNDSNASNDVINELDNKDAKDTFRNWLSGKYQPSFKYVENLDKQASDSELNVAEWKKIKWGLISSRFINYFDPDYSNKTITSQHSEAFKVAHSKNAMQFIQVKQIIVGIFSEFKLKGMAEKNNEDKQKLEQLLSLLSIQIKAVDPQFSIDYTYHQFKARHLVLAGKLEDANKEYKAAFESSLYRAHSKAQIQLVIREALLVAAKQKRPDKVFILRLKSAAILLKFDNLPAKIDEEGKNRPPVLYNNEVEEYRQKFDAMFPDRLAYPSVTYPKYNQTVGLLIETEELDETELLKKNKIKIGSEYGVQRVTTPLIDAASKNNIGLALKLVEAGSSVNVTSEVGDSPLLLALDQLDFEDPFSSMDDRLFELFSNKQHSEITLNTVTERKMRFPLYAAVDTGKPSIVKKVISLNSGINIDLRGGLDYISSLYQAMGIIGKIKNPKALLQSLSEPNEETIHRLKPMFAGMPNMSNNDIIEAFNGNNLDTPEKKHIYDALQLTLESRQNRKPTLSAARHVARILINAGACSNLKHKIKGKEYSPLMLAAEFDELKLFKSMIEKGGNWKKTYVLPEDSLYPVKAINCLHIAKEFKAKNVIEYIENNLI